MKYFRNKIAFPFLVAACLASFSGTPGAAEIPDSWRAEWENPSAKNRPLQIIHGWFGDRTTPEKLRYFTDECGLGGLVVNVSSKEYLRNENEWQRLVDVVRLARDVGLRIWIYDEDGYPSLMAGGVVLDGHPELESQALVYDAVQEGDAAFSVRPAYEYTHASNKHAPSRRYPNPLDPAATRRFLDVTHEQYKQRLGDLHGDVEAYFTDEPSLNAVNLGQIPEHIRVTIPTVDPVNPDVPLLPMVPWSDALRQELEKGGQPLNRKSLFTGDTEADKRERRRFWEAVARLNGENYYQAIRDWCRANGVAATGHLLHEEIVVGHVPLDGDKLGMMRLFDIPGLDQLNSDPKANLYGGWKALAFPASAAALNGTRLVMTEISDHGQRTRKDDPRPAELSWMQAASAGEAAWGVTEFTLYYGIADRGESVHKAYCDYVGRLNAILREATPQYTALLYYPSAELQREYRPTAQPLSLEAQSERMKEVVGSFDRLGDILVRSQVPFILVDDRGVRDWVRRSGRGDWPLFVPRGVEISPDIAGLGLKIRCDDSDDAVSMENVRQKLAAETETFDPPSRWLTFGKFLRDGKTIYVVVNADDKAYHGVLRTPETVGTATGSQLDPATGVMTSLPTGGNLPVTLEPSQAVLLCR